MGEAKASARSVHASLKKAVCKWLRHFDLYKHTHEKRASMLYDVLHANKCTCQNAGLQTAPDATGCTNSYGNSSKAAVIPPFNCLFSPDLLASLVCPWGHNWPQACCKSVAPCPVKIHKHSHHQSDIARLQIVHTDSLSIYRQSLQLQTVNTDEWINVPKLKHYLFPGIDDMAYLNA